MPVEKQYADSMLGTFRTMYQDLFDKKAGGSAFEKLKTTLDRMEQLALEMEDLSSFSAKLTTEGLFVNFSNLYAEVAGEMAAKQYAKISSDEELMEQTLAAYESSLKSYEKEPKQKSLYDTMKQIIDLGRSGISYPVFLRICEEKGLYKLLEGGTMTRDGLVEEKTFNEIFSLPVQLQKTEALIKVYDELAEQSAFKAPDTFLFGLERIRLDWHYAPVQNRWDEVCRGWDRLLELIHDWLDSYGDFAPHDFRWVDMGDPQKTLRNIKRTNDCNPGFLKERERIFYEYFQLKWDDIFSHETFLSEFKAGRIWYSDESLDLIKETYTHCKPFNKPTKELIKHAEDIYHNKRYRRVNSFQLSEKDQQRLQDLIGKEKFEKIYGAK
jgi:hypothetical protein